MAGLCEVKCAGEEARKMRYSVHLDILTAARVGKKSRSRRPSTNRVGEIATSFLTDPRARSRNFTGP